tara:strand:+ start:1 stop:1041 length:1041 start_codon:yes stop_codon:yes gene_type:complete
MSLKQKELINIWVFKDGKKGHEKQIDALVDELRESNKISLLTVDCHKSNFVSSFLSYIKGVPSKEIDEATDNWVMEGFDITSGMTPFGNYPDLLVGAGSKTHYQLLLAKKLFPNSKSIVLMKPSLKPTQLFDIAVVPHLDKFYFRTPENVITTKGVLSKYSTERTKKKTGLIIIGGKSRHFHFRPKVLMKQIEWLLNDLYKDYQWKITTSPRSPDLKIPKHPENAEFFNWKDTSDEWLTTEIKKSEITFLTPESVSILYEALSTNTNVYVFHHELHRDHGTEGAPLRKTKVTKNIELLKKNKDIGFIDTKRYLFSRDIRSADICHPKKNKPLSEVKDVVSKLLEIL